MVLSPELIAWALMYGTLAQHTEISSSNSITTIPSQNTQKQRIVPKNQWQHNPSKKHPLKQPRPGY